MVIILIVNLIWAIYIEIEYFIETKSLFLSFSNSKLNDLIIEGKHI